MIKKVLENYSLSGHPINFCKVKWQLTDKKNNPLQFILHQTRHKKKKITQIIIDMAKYFFLNVSTLF